MKTIVTSILTFISFNVMAQSGLTSVDSLQAFNCTLVSAAGFTKLNYAASSGSVVAGRRNGFFPVQYNVNAAGTYDDSEGEGDKKSQITLSGGALAENQYLTMLFNQLVPSGESSAAGTLLLVTMGGSVFAPVMSDYLPIGRVTCSSMTVK